jgi:DNA-binding response OmpR family regulator
MRILVIDADASALTATLRAEGHQVDIATDGLSGLARALAASHALIVLEADLPGLDGLTLCQRLRERRVFTPILITGALDSPARRAEALIAGADDALCKPCDPAELLARLAALHRRAVGYGGGTRLQVDDLEFDLATAEASRAGTRIDLTRTGRRLLEVLLRRSPKLVTRNELERALWGDEVPEGDVLRAHMHNLRNAIDKPFARKLIQTVHGEGYRLTALDA